MNPSSWDGVRPLTDEEKRRYLSYNPRDWLTTRQGEPCESIASLSDPSTSGGAEASTSDSTAASSIAGGNAIPPAVERHA